MKKALALFLGALAMAFAFAQPASAQTRTWVSGVGDDVNPCSRTAPCKTFAGAISKTATGGEINCLDPGGFGTLTITKSITVDCSDVFGSTLNAGGINGFVINDSASATPQTADVVLRNIHINGAGTVTGLNGIRFISGRSLVVENVTIQAQSARGISIQPSNAAAIRVLIRNTSIINSGGGILIQPTTVANGNARVDIDDVRITGTASEGIRVDTTGITSGAGLRVGVNNVQISENGGAGILVNSPVGTVAGILTLTDSRITQNSGNGLVSQGSANALMLVGNTTIQGNASGLVRSGGGQIQSYGNNRLNINIIADGTFSGPATES